jgi:hypothetical protein
MKPWNKIADGLPKKEGLYLACDVNDQYGVDKYLFKNGYFHYEWYGDWRRCDRGDITHWMEIPPKPTV